MTQAIEPCTAALKEVSLILSDLAAVARGTRAARESSEELPDRYVVRARRVAFLLRRTCEDVASARSCEELSEILVGTADDAPNAAEVLRSLSELVDQYVREAERLYGPKTGPQKLRFAKAALLRFMREADVDIPHVPGLMEPFVLDAFATIIVEAVFQLVNRGQILPRVERGAGAPESTSYFARRRFWLERKLSDFAWWLLRLCYRTPSQVERTIDEIVTPGDAETLRDAIELQLQLMRWGVENLAAVKALADVAVQAVEEAQLLAELSPRQKRTYARMLLMEFLIDIGVLRGRSELFKQITAGFLDGVVDSVVALFVRHKDGWEEQDAWYCYSADAA